MPTTPTALIILDGFGYSKDTESNAIYHAHKPTIDYFLHHYPIPYCMQRDNMSAYCRA